MKSRSKADRAITPTASRFDKNNFPIVGIGASAGGLRAIESFFKEIKDNAKTEMAYVIVQHLDPNHKSMLLDLVKKFTKMDVYVVENGMEVKPDCVYIIPPNRNMALINGTLLLEEFDEPRGLRLPIDYFIRSLANDIHEKAICIILSGTGSDGTLGLKAVKGEGGMVVVQSPESAAFDGMPRSAIATNLADYILPPDKIPQQLKEYVKYASGKLFYHAAAPIIADDSIIKKIFLLLREQTGHNFLEYKQNMIRRRIERRMVVNRIEHTEDYFTYLKNNLNEVETLFRELLIGVTNFFRDPELFESIKENVLPKFFENKSFLEPIRVWIPGCSTGEEAFSFAIMFQEYIDNLKQNFNVQIFATDIDEDAIAKARAGIYLDNIAADVSSERLSQFFKKENGSYRIRKSIREMVIFAKQDIIKDPPFSKMDFISCRNLLIYFNGTLQKRMIPLFHYSLNQNGFLILGTSESIGEYSELFSTLMKKQKIFKRKGINLRRYSESTYFPPAFEGKENEEKGMTTTKDFKMNIKEKMESFLLEEFAQPCVIINADFEVLYVNGHTGKYLELVSGEASLNINKMIRPGLSLKLTTGVRRVIASQNTVRYNGLKIKNNGGYSVINLIIRPIKKTETIHGLILIIFEEVSIKTENVTRGRAGKKNTDKDKYINELETEIKAKEEHLQTIIEELETSNEELKSTNEELQSTNEELQSTNEELETSKEELQSVNEELITLNSEYQKKIEELSQVNNDMNNLLASTGIGTIFIDHNLIIQRFTPAATKIINLIQTDIGRKISDIVSRLTDYPNLVEDINSVLDTLIPKDAQVTTSEGSHYRMRIQPYRTLDNVIEGTVLTFVEKLD